MTDWIEELERLGELREKGLLSEEEFEAKKSELLSSERGSPVQQVETILKWAPIKQKYVKGFKWAFSAYILFFLAFMIGIATFMIRAL
tara:strand:- start:5481 stop:5744 length:264 start_codon:yes stop_codon:yes gene_type:complete